MKNKYILLFIVVLFNAITVQAQEYDLSIKFAAHSEGATVTAQPLNVSVIITNEGDATISTTDTLVLGYSVNGVPVKFTDINSPGATSTFLEEDLIPGASTFAVGATAVTFTSDFNADFCAVVYGIGSASFSGFEGDANPEDNTSCINVDVLVGLEDGIEKNELFNQVYVSQKKLIFISSKKTVSKKVFVSLCSVDGKIVERRSFLVTEGINVVSLENLKSGIYFALAQVDDYRGSYKFLVE